MYEPHEMLTRISANAAMIISLCTIALLANYLWYGEMIRLARRDRVVSCPPATTLFYLAHDGSYLFLFKKWFVQYDHWFCKLFFVGIVITFAMEAVMFAQTLRYGRKELAPSWTQAEFTAAMCAALVGVSALWVATKFALGDELYLLSFMVAIGWAAPFGTTWLLRRQTTAGSSRLTWISFSMIGAPYFLCTLLVFGPEFRTWSWVFLGTASVGWGIFNTWLVGRMRPPAATSA